MSLEARAAAISGKIDDSIYLKNTYVSANSNDVSRA